MKFNKFMIYAMFLLALLTLGAVNAADNVTADDLAVVSDNEYFDASLQNDVVNACREISSDDVLTKDVNEDISEISNDDSQLDKGDYDKLTLIPVTLDVKVVDNSRVDINAGNVTGNVIVIVDTIQNTVPLNKDGSASFPLNDLSSGNHSLVVVFQGDETYEASHSASVFNIPEKVSLIDSTFGNIVIGDDFTVAMVLMDANSKAIANVPVRYSVNGVSSNLNTDSKGLVTIVGKAGAVIDVFYDGNEKFAATNASLTLNNPVSPSVVKVDSHFNISGGVINIKGYAVDVSAGEEGIYYTTELLDADGNPIKGVNIQFVAGNNIYDRITLGDGSFDPYKFNMVKAGKYDMYLFFKGNDKYSSAFASVFVNLAKKPITIKASAKTYKVSATKKYSITLSTIVGSSHDGKAHLSPKKVTLKVNGKTYSAKTNKAGKATFKLKLTKKGKYTAKISFAGDNTYKAKTKSVRITIK